MIIHNTRIIEIFIKLYDHIISFPEGKSKCSVFSSLMGANGTRRS